MISRGLLGSICFAVVLLLSGCDDPPLKEIDLAQGAIDAARAAGAEEYAAAEYSAARSALDGAQAAVAARDFRLALNYALESHERAQNAARDTANAKARLHADVERTLAEVDALITRGQERIAAAEGARVPDRLVAEPAERLIAARASVQEAREAVAAGDYRAASAVLDGVKSRAEEAVAALDAAAASQSSPRRR